MKKISLLAMGLVLLTATSALAQAPRKGMALDDGNVTKYGARMRVTKTAWDFVMLTLRDNFKEWSLPEQTGLGANLLLDPGYFPTSPGSAGFVRTTPYLYDYVRFDYGNINRNTWTVSCGGCVCGGCNRSANCGQSCSKTAAQAPGTRWTQVRKPGAALATNQPGLPWEVQVAFRERGFYVADAGADFKQMQFCTNRGTDGDFYFDSGSGKSGQCQDLRKEFEICAGLCTTVYFFYNVRLFLFPNMRTEYMGINGTFPRDPAQGWENWNPPVNRGAYTGMPNNFGNPPNSQICATLQTANNCSNGGWCSTSGSCCCTWCACVCDNHFANCNAANGFMGTYVFQQPISGHNPLSGYNQRDGTYIRGGDEQALYTNIGQMQIHSYDRSTFLGAESTANKRNCMLENYYTGRFLPPSTANPEILTHTTKVANCMNPKSWWNFSTLKWQPCNPFDTWNADGTYNLANDDAKWIYPGHPDTGANGFGGVSPMQCGAQTACTGIACGNPPATRRTTNFKDLFSPGGGWYFLRIADIRMIPGVVPLTSNIATHPRIEVDLVIPDVRVELGAAITLRTEGTLVVDQTYRNIRALGQIKLNAITVKANIRIYSTDDSSCIAGAANVAGCTGNYRPMNNNLNDPDKIAFEVDIPDGSFTITSPNPWYVGDCDSVTMVLLRDPIFGTDLITATVSACDVLNDDLVVWGINIGSVGIKDMLTGIVEDALQGEIETALAGFAAAIPNLNGIMGDPINLLNKSLIDTGIYATGGVNDNVTMADTTKRWPLPMYAGPAINQEITEFRLSLGFKPVPFRPATGIYSVMDIDTNDPPLNDSIYGVPTLMDPNTSGCGAACSRGSRFPAKDTDQVYDFEDRIVGAAGGVYKDPKSGANISLPQYRRIPEFWQGPINVDQRPPDWCSTLRNTIPNREAPNVVRSGGGTLTDFQTLYPQTTWLKFHSTLDLPPAGSGFINPAGTNTYGDWDKMKPNTIFTQNLNTGAKDPTAIPYDFTLHIHQRTIAQFLQTAVASGATCIEFAAQDTMGADTPWKSFLTTDIFASVLPNLYYKFPGKAMKVRMSSYGTPRARTGLGSLTYNPTVPGVPAGEAPRPIAATPYMISAAFPDTRIEFLVEDEDVGDISILVMYWTPVVGIHSQGIRRCYYLDPWASDERCTSPFVNVRTVSGYQEIYVDMGSPSLKTAWVNAKDFGAGYFDDIGTRRFFNGAGTLDKSHIVIESTYCTGGASGCNQLAVSQLVPTLMNSFISVFFLSRFSFMDLTVDLLYTGVDGPNDDAVGGGDYIGIYARFLGNLNLFSLLESLDTLFAPRDGIEPMAFVPGATNEVQWFNTNTPVFPVETVRQLGKDSNIGYTYSLNSGFWHTPVKDAELNLGTLWEGKHKLALRAVETNNAGSIASLKPVEVEFRVDTLAPKVEIQPSAKGVYNKPVEIDVTDLQTPKDALKTSYKWDDGEWAETESSALSIRKLDQGKHTLHVRSTDLAGNVGEAARVVVVGEGNWWGCNQQDGTPDAGWLFVLLALMMPALRKHAIRTRR